MTSVPRESNAPLRVYQFADINGAVFIFYERTFRAALMKWAELLDEMTGDGEYNPAPSLNSSVGQWRLASYTFVDRGRP
jgi:hypothetical protein